VNYARLLSLKVIHKSEVNKAMSGLATTVVSLCALVGVIFGVMFVVKSRRSDRPYARVVLAESHHGSVMDVTKVDMQHGQVRPRATAE